MTGIGARRDAKYWGDERRWTCCRRIARKSWRKCRRAAGFKGAAGRLMTEGHVFGWNLLGQPFYLDAIRAAEAQDDQFEGIPVAPPEHLAAMKLAAGTDKDERDAIRLIAKVKDLDVEATRGLVRNFLGPGSKSVFAAQDTHRPGGPTAWAPEQTPTGCLPKA
jgi:hypothetical protein